MPRYNKQDFYSWYAGLKQRREELEYLMNNTGGIRGMSYEYRGGKTNKRTSIVEQEYEELERLEAEYWNIAETILKVGYAMTDILCYNPIGYRVIDGKLKGKTARQLKGADTYKDLREGETEGINRIKNFLDRYQVNYLF